MASHRPTSLWRWTHWVAGALLAFVLAYVAVTLFAGGAAGATTLDLMSTVPPFAVLVLCGFAAARAANSGDRRFWALIGLAHACTLVSEAIWAYNGTAGGIPGPIFSMADVGWVAFYPFAFAAVLVLITFRGLSRLEAATQVLDAVLFAIAAGALSWVTLVAPYHASSDGVLSSAMVIGYNAGDVLLLLGLAAIWIGPNRDSQPRGLGWLCSSFIVMLIADATLSSLTAVGSYQAGSWSGPLWPLAYMLAGWGALAYLDNRTGRRLRGTAGPSPVVDLMTERAKVVAERARIALPYLVLPVIETMLLVRFIVHRGEGGAVGDAATIGLAVILTALILVRQLLVMVANHRLEVSLKELSGELESRVIDRTEELAVEKEHLALLNRVAAEMSHCVTAKEVVRHGLRLIRRTGRCSATGMLLTRPGKHSQFFGSPGLTRSGRLQLLAVVECDAAATVSAKVEPAVMEGAGLAGCLVERGLQPVFERVVLFPLVARRSVFGLICLGYRKVSGEVSGEAMALVQGVASQIAITLENAWRYEELEHLADHDAVTGLLNHRGLSRRMEQELARCQRAGTHFSLVTMDLDGFKLFNDTYGHAVGDGVLRHVARILRRMMRRSDVVGRQGGDEFSAILPDASNAQAVEAVERIRDALADSAICLDGQTLIPLFMSYGIATYPDEGRRVSELLAVADANLYRSKQRGGNCVSAAVLRDDEHAPPAGIFSVLDGLVNAVDNKDHYTRKHSEDVTELSLALAARLGLPAETVRSLRIAALLHDVGKIGIPDFILRKPGPLTSEESEAIKQHVSFSELFIKEIPDVMDVVRAVGAHHERWDGSGYPRGLSGEQIPVLGRILAVSDAYSAMTSDRPYRKGLSPGDARKEMERVAGSQLDPHLVELFLAEIDGRATAPQPAGEARADKARVGKTVTAGCGTGSRDTAGRIAGGVA